MRRIWGGAFALGWVLAFNSMAIAVTSNWTGLGGNNDFHNAANWSGGVPTDDAGFNTATPTAISLSTNESMLSMTFNPGAAAYTITTPNWHLDFSGAFASGVHNNSGVTQTFVVGDSAQLNFFNNASPGDATYVVNGGTMLMQGVNFAQHAIFNIHSGNVNFNQFSSGDNATFTTSGDGVLNFSVFAEAGSATITNNATTNFLGSADAAQASLTNNGILSFYNSSTGGNATIVNNSGGSILLLNNGNLGSAVLTNNGTVDASLSGNATITAGSISGSGTFVMSSRNLTVGSNNANTTFSGTISGNGGSLTKTGNGTLTLSGNNTFTGDTTINAGTLNVLGTLAGDAVVGAAGTLPGTGTLGSISNSGTVTPGSNSAGTMSAFSYSGTGTLRPSFNGSSHGSLRLIGNADITGGTLDVTGSSFGVGRYSVLNANTLTGTFSTFASPASTTLSFAPSYSDTDAYVVITFLTPFGSYAQNSNEIQVGSHLNGAKDTASGDFTNQIITLGQLPTAQIPDALAQISGDSLASFQNVGLQNAAVFIQGMHERAVHVSSNSYGLWAQGVGYIDEMKRDSAIGSPASHATTGGFQAGYDLVAGDNWLAGYSGGYTDTSLDVSDRSSSGDSKSIQAGIYAQNHRGPLRLHGSLAYSVDTNGMTRSIRYGSVNEHANSNFGSRVLTTFLESGYQLQRSGILILEPTLSLRQSHLVQRSFTESGAPGLGLTIADHTLNSWMSSLGLELKRQFRQESTHPLAFMGTLAWEHEWGTTENAIQAHFAETSGGSDFTVEGTPRGRDAGVLGVEGSVPLAGDLTAFANSSARLSSTETSVRLLGGVRLRF
jgi:autotransporter-associated beta strand protein